jgi:TolB-like protein
MSETPDDKIVAEFRELMNEVAHGLDELFNGKLKGTDRTVCFVLLTTPFADVGGEDRVNYISNGTRKDVVTMLKEITRRFEGQPEMKGST